MVSIGTGHVAQLEQLPSPLRLLESDQGYSLIYLLGGGGLFGAIVIFIVAKMFGK
jgi:hypothetical protein